MLIIPQKMQTDKDEKFLDATECRSKTNLRTGLSEDGTTLSNENIQSNVLIPSGYYEDNDMVIGACEDISNDSIIFNVYNPDATKNKICRYFPFDNDRVELILKHEYLGFREDYKITQHNVISGLYYWTFGYFNSFLNNDYNPPRKINLEKAKKFTDKYADRWEFTSITDGASYGNPADAFNPNGYTAYVGTSSAGWNNIIQGDYVVAWANEGDAYGYRYKPATGYCKIVSKQIILGTYYVIITDRPLATLNVTLSKTGHILKYEPDMYFGIDWQVMDRIKYAPEYRARPSYLDIDTDMINMLKDNLYQFSYQYIYDDNETSTWSEWSIVPLPLTPDYTNLSYSSLLKKDNRINVWINTGSMEVKAINVAFRKSNIGDWVQTKRIEKYDSEKNCTLTSDIFVLYPFENEDVTEGLDQSDIARPFDFVPQISNRQELIEKNRLVDGNFTEGYDNTNIDVSLGYTTEQVNVGAFFPNITDWQNKYFFANASSPDYFYGGIINFGGYYDPGYTYTVQITNYPEQYTDPNMYLQNPYPAEYNGKYIEAMAFIVTDSSTTQVQFMTQVIEQLRSGTGTKCVIAFGSPLTGLNYFGNYTNISYTGVSHLGINELGFIIEPAQAPGGGIINPCSTCSTVSVRVTKILGSNRYTSFKSGVHPFGIIYRDRGMRTGAVNVSDQSSVYVPSQNEVALPHEIVRTEVTWEINHIPPEWATWYSWVYALNNTESYYLYASIAQIGYVADMNFLYININEYVGDTKDKVTRFNVTPYEWQNGDRIRFVLKQGADLKWYTFGETLDFEILGVYQPDATDIYAIDKSGKTDGSQYIKDGNGNRIVDPSKQGHTIPLFDYSAYGIDVDNTIVEIYRPKKKSDTLVYYQFGDWLPVLNPHTANRTHGGDGTSVSQNQTSLLPAKGKFENGDCYIFMRIMFNSFPCESRWFSDFYDSETVSIGRPNMTNRNMRRQSFYSYLRYGNIYIENSLTNGLSTFYGSDIDVLPEKYREIASMRENGEVLRVIQKNKCTSIYIGKGEMKQPVIGDEGVVALSPSVIGSKRQHIENYGCVFPESVVNTNNFTYFFDVYNSVYLRWANNGIQQITYKDATYGIDFGMGAYFRKKCSDILTIGIENVKVYAAYDKEYESLIVSFVARVLPAGMDSFNETIVFYEPENAWIMKASYIPEFYGSNKKCLVAFKDGHIWKQNAGTDYNTFFGIPYKSEIEVVGHEKPDEVQVFNDVEIITNSDQWAAPNTGDVSVNIIGGQMKSRLKKDRFVNREGKMVATFGKDMFTTGQEVITDIVAGRELRGHAIKVRFENDSTNKVTLSGININSSTSE